MAKKPANKTTRQQRTANKSVATPAIHTVSKIVELLAPYELSRSLKYKTFLQMSLDDAIAPAVESRVTSIEVAQSKPTLDYDKNSERSVWLKDFIEYNLSVLQGTTRQVGRNAASMIMNGSASFDIVTKLDKSGSEYSGMFVLDKLTFIDPLTIDPVKPFVTEDGGRELKYWRQLISAFTDTNGQQQKTNSVAGAVLIDDRRVATSSYSSTSGRPLGDSVFEILYKPWREKILLTDLLLAGCTKDLAGTPVLRIPESILQDAQDPNSAAAATVRQLTEHMTNMHQGDSTFCILPSSLVEGSSSIQDYDITFKGVEGSGKQFDMVEIIEAKRKAIFNVLGASHLITGENGGGSYNLYEGAANTAAFYSLRDNTIIDEMYNEKIIPHILKLNGLTDEKFSDIPKYKHGEVQPLSADEAGKFTQRVASVGMLPVVPDTVNRILEIFGTTYRVDDDMSTEELREIMSNFVSNAAEGLGTSGTGDSQSGGASSDTNSENAA